MNFTQIALRAGFSNPGVSPSEHRKVKYYEEPEPKPIKVSQVHLSMTLVTSLRNF